MQLQSAKVCRDKAEATRGRVQEQGMTTVRRLKRDGNEGQVLAVLMEERRRERKVRAQTISQEVFPFHVQESREGEDSFNKERLRHHLRSFPRL